VGLRKEILRCGAVEFIGGYVSYKKTIKACFDKCLVTAIVHKQSGTAHESVSDNRVNQIRHTFQRSSTKSISQTSRELQVPVQDVAQRSVQMVKPVCIQSADCPGTEARLEVTLTELQC
jgi:hypothetical protein